MGQGALSSHLLQLEERVLQKGDLSVEGLFGGDRRGAFCVWINLILQLHLLDLLQLDLLVQLVELLVVLF